MVGEKIDPEIGNDKQIIVADVKVRRTFRQIFLNFTKWIVAGMFILALADMGSVYYKLLRVVSTIFAIIVLIDENSKIVKNKNLLIVYWIICILFNPFVPIYLYDKELWLIPDLLTAIIIITTSFGPESKLLLDFTRKNRRTARVLAIFFGVFSWIYSYKIDSKKFWWNLIISILTAGYWYFGCWLWAMYDAFKRAPEFYDALN